MIWILGNCAIENRETYMETAKILCEIMAGSHWYYKGSFDKANRSSIDGKRGLGLKGSIELFKECKERYKGIMLTTDIHEVWQVEKLKGIIDVIQIPAFLCRQTDLIIECAKHFKVVNIKKGQWMSPQNMIEGVDKIKTVNNDCQAWITERGSQFGYGQLLVDFGAVELLKKHFDKVILDCTHSTQRLKPNGRTGGNREMAKKHMKSAGIYGYDGIFTETHPRPEEAISDSECQIPLDELKYLT